MDYRKPRPQPLQALHQFWMAIAKANRSASFSFGGTTGQGMRFCEAMEVSSAFRHFFALSRKVCASNFSATCPIFPAPISISYAGERKGSAPGFAVKPAAAKFSGCVFHSSRSRVSSSLNGTEARLLSCGIEARL